MSIIKRKFAPASMKMAVNLALIVAFLSQIIAPVAVVADVEKDLAKVSQNTVFQELSIKEIPGYNVWAKPTTQTIKVNVPDRVIKTAVITAYTSTPDQTDDTPFIAATGKRVHDGMIAANGLPFGTKVKIPSVYGDKVFIVEDRMNSRYGYGRFDVWLDTTRAEARKFGVKRVTVEIYLLEKAIAKK